MGRRRIYSGKSHPVCSSQPQSLNQITEHRNRNTGIDCSLAHESKRNIRVLPQQSLISFGEGWVACLMIPSAVDGIAANTSLGKNFCPGERSRAFLCAYEIRGGRDLQGGQLHPMPLPSGERILLPPHTSGKPSTFVRSQRKSILKHATLAFSFFAASTRHFENRKNKIAHIRWPPEF